MQTFLPYPDFKKSSSCLDWKRLGKQRVEAFQILKAIQDPNYGWSKHPCTHMWFDFTDALKLYMNTCILEWISRGYNNTMKLAELPDIIQMPTWLGNEEFHSIHRANLIRKDPEFYLKYGWTEQPDQGYLWPKKSENNSFTFVKK